jgi:hypothetical protein
MRKSMFFAAAALAALTSLAGCVSMGRGHGPIETLVIPASANPGLPGDIVGSINLAVNPHEIRLVVPPGTNLHALVAKFSLNAEASIAVISSGNKVAQQNGATPNDFSVPVIYSVEVPGEKKPWLYRVIAREMETNPRLGQLFLPAGARLQPTLDPSVHEYMAELPFASAVVRIEARAQSQFAKSVSIDGRESSGPVGRADVDFASIQQKPIAIDILAEDGVTRDRYAVTLVRGAPDDNARLGSLDIQGLALSSPFSPAQMNYQLVVPFETRGLVVRAKAESRFASVALAAGSVTGGQSATPLAGAGDPTTSSGAAIDFTQTDRLALVVAVTAQDGRVQQYFVDVLRGAPDSNNFLSDLSLGVGATGLALSPDFNPGQLRYSALLPFSSPQVRIVAHPQSGVAALNLSGGRAGGAVQGDPRSPAGALVDLPAGIDRFSLLLMVAAQDGSARGYIVDLRRAPPDRNSELLSLVASDGSLSPPFNPRQLSYSLSLPATSEGASFSVCAASPGATVSIAGQQGIAPARSLAYAIKAAPGSSAVLGLVVRAEDGSQRQYLVQISRAAAAAPAPAPAPAPVGAAPAQLSPQAPAPAPAPSPSGSGRSDHLLVSAKDLALGSRELAALGASKDAVGATAKITVRPYRSSEILAQGSAAVETRARGEGLALSLQYRSPGIAALGQQALVEIEVVIPTVAGKFLYYKEALPAAGDLDLTIPFLLYETAVPVAWPALGSPTQVAGYASMGGKHPDEGEAFQKNAKGEYRVDVDLVDVKTGRAYGQAVSWKKPALARGQALAFAAPLGIPEGSTVGYSITARAANGRAWTATGQAQVLTTRLRYEGGFEPVLLPLSDELAPAADQKGGAGGGKD